MRSVLHMPAAGSRYCAWQVVNLSEPGKKDMLHVSENTMDFKFDTRIQHFL